MSMPAEAPEPARAWLPSARELREVAAREGIDAATRMLYCRVLESPAHGAFIRRLAEISRRPAPFRWPREATLAIVPGAFYREKSRSGADGAVVRGEAERLGCPTELVPLASRGGIEENARILCEWLVARGRAPLVLVSLSKGGADVKAALARPDAARAFAGVATWINLCGTLDGTPMAEWVLSWNPAAVLNRLYHRLSGQSLAFLGDLRYGAGGPLCDPLHLPPHLRLVSVVGFPLREHLVRGVSRRCHRRLRHLGPNDGALVLADVCALPGLLFPFWGADHYLRPDPRAIGPPPPPADWAPTVSELIAAILQHAGESLTWSEPGTRRA